METTSGKSGLLLWKRLGSINIKILPIGDQAISGILHQAKQAPIPVSEDVLSAFVAMLAEEGLSYSSIRLYLSAIRYHHIKSDLGEPGISAMPRLAYIVKGVKREGVYTQSTKPQRERQPITPDTRKCYHLEWKVRSCGRKDALGSRIYSLWVPENWRIHVPDSEYL